MRVTQGLGASMGRPGGSRRSRVIPSGRSFGAEGKGSVSPVRVRQPPAISPKPLDGAKSRAPSKAVLRFANKELLAPADIVALQVTAGNQAVSSLFEQRAAGKGRPSAAEVPIVRGINDGSVDLFTGKFAIPVGPADESPEEAALEGRSAYTPQPDESPEQAALEGRSAYTPQPDESPEQAAEGGRSAYTPQQDEEAPVAAPSPASAAPASAGAARRPMPAAVASKKYANLRSRLPAYAWEFIDGSTELRKTILPAAVALLKPGQSIHSGMMKMCGWSQEDCDKYLQKNELVGNPLVAKVERKDRHRYELVSEGGTFHQGGPDKPGYDTSGKFSIFMKSGYAIYVMSPDGKFYAEGHKPGLFHHSSFLAGGDVAGAGEMKVENGSLKVITNKSGHYQPRTEEMLQVFAELESRGIDLSAVEYNHVEKTAEGEKADFKARWPGPGGGAAGGAKAFYDKFKDRPAAAP
jgi:hypothetical protein